MPSSLEQGQSNEYKATRKSVATEKTTKYHQEIPSKGGSEAKPEKGKPSKTKKKTPEQKKEDAMAAMIQSKLEQKYDALMSELSRVNKEHIKDATEENEYTMFFQKELDRLSDKEAWLAKQKNTETKTRNTKRKRGAFCGCAVDNSAGESPKAAARKEVKRIQNKF